MAQVSQEKEAAIAEKERAIAGVKSTYDSLVSELKQEIKQGEVQITQLKDKLTVNMVEKILFDSGSAVIKKNGDQGARPGGGDPEGPERTADQGGRAYGQRADRPAALLKVSPPTGSCQLPGRRRLCAICRGGA